MWEEEVGGASQQDELLEPRIMFIIPIEEERNQLRNVKLEIISQLSTQNSEIGVEATTL